MISLTPLMAMTAKTEIVAPPITDWGMVVSRAENRKELQQYGHGRRQQRGLDHHRGFGIRQPAALRHNEVVGIDSFRILNPAIEMQRERVRNPEGSRPPGSVYVII